MALRTLASGTIKRGSQAIYTAPTGRWSEINNIQFVNKSGGACILDVVLRSASDEVNLIPPGLSFPDKFKVEIDQPHALSPGGFIKVTCSAAGVTFVVTGEERTSL